VRHRFVLSNYQIVPVGRKLAEDRGSGMTLYETRGALRLKASLVGVYPDRWSGPGALWTQYGCDGGALRVHLLSDPVMYNRAPQSITAQVNGKTVRTFAVPTTRAATIAVPLPRHVVTCAVNFAVTPTAVPAQVFPNNPDTRTLGIRFTGFDYRPAG
jgi:hypothetical protein